MSRPTPKRQEWIARVRRLNQSGLPVGEFAAREGVHPGTLALWRARLEGGGELSGAEAASSVALSFVALSFVALSFVALEPVERSSSAGPVPFDVGLGNGRSVRVWPHFDAAELRRLVVFSRTCKAGGHDPTAPSHPPGHGTCRYAPLVRWSGALGGGGAGRRPVRGETLRDVAKKSRAAALSQLRGAAARAPQAEHA
jgi:hypothetical protein